MDNQYHTEFDIKEHERWDIVQPETELQREITVLDIVYAGVQSGKLKPLALIEVTKCINMEDVDLLLQKHKI